MWLPFFALLHSRLPALTDQGVAVLYAVGTPPALTQLPLTSCPSCRLPPLPSPSLPPPSLQRDTFAPMALTYNDRSVNENMHVSLAFKLAAEDPDLNIFAHFSRAEYKLVREGVQG